MTLFEITLPGEAPFRAKIQGHGGHIGGATSHVEDRKRADAESLRRVQNAQRLVAEGFDTCLFEPRPGYCRAYLVDAKGRETDETREVSLAVAVIRLATVEGGDK